MSQLTDLIDRKNRTVVGIMSGTSLDGVDVAVVDIESSTDAIQFQTLAFRSFNYDDHLRSLLLKNSANESASLEEVTRLNFVLARRYADAVTATLASNGIDRDKVDLVGSHGQTICHLPQPDNELPPATLQIGDPSVLANLLGIPVVGDFRVADMALGGQGAPLVPYFDYRMLRDRHINRGALNLGGIANLTVLPAGCDLDQVTAFDTGPANMLLDLLARRFMNAPYDEGGKCAATGNVHEPTLNRLLNDAYFQLKPPKSTGREDFGEVYADNLVQMLRKAGVADTADIMATAAALTIQSIVLAYERLVKNQCAIDELVIAGGGHRNEHLVEGLHNGFKNVEVMTTEKFGIDPDAKEAICFAVLANEAIEGVASNVPSVTGASRRTILGKICLPLR